MVINYIYLEVFRNLFLLFVHIIYTGVINDNFK